jgi:UDP-2,3-diacylglucosamine pyrophosphatase LpxH
MKNDIKTMQLVTTADSRFVVFSDAHRGDGTGADDFAANSLIFKCALDHYLAEGFTLIELGDAEDLWEIGHFDQIYITHTSIYRRLAAFHDSDPEKSRYIKIWGNHDRYWKDNEASLRGLFPGIVVYEAALLDGHILLWHGHQADPSCSGARARLTKFLVGKLWTAAQRYGVRDPTRAANNPGRCDRIDETLHAWATGGLPDALVIGDSAPFSKGPEKRAQSPITKIDTIIAGHTHRPVYENLSLTERMYLESHVGTRGIRRKFHADPAYYNTGSCVHPRCITGIEITPGQAGRPAFTLVKWGYAAQCAVATPGAGCGAYTLTIQREELENQRSPSAPNPFSFPQNAKLQDLTV